MSEPHPSVWLWIGEPTLAQCDEQAGAQIIWFGVMIAADAERRGGEYEFHCETWNVMCLRMLLTFSICDADLVFGIWSAFDVV
jgi:hypothetical protein